MPKARRETGVVVRIAQAQDGLMNPLTEAPYNSTMAPSGVLLLLLILFAASGCAALIYEIVWFQLLQLTIGSSAISLGILLATYMGGLCIGSLAFPRIVSTERHPFRVYASLEAAIGVLSVLVLVSIPYLDEIYVRGVTPGAISVAFRAVISGVCLLPPTFLMGASLPAMARWLKTTTEGVSWLGLFYGANIAGAVSGDLLAGFYLLRVYDVVFATFVAVGINVLSVLIAVAMSTWIQYSRPVSSADADGLPPQNRTWTAVHVAIALSGLCALGAEVIWTRLLSLMLGATAYTFQSSSPYFSSD